MKNFAKIYGILFLFTLFIQILNLFTDNLPEVIKLIIKWLSFITEFPLTLIKREWPYYGQNSILVGLFLVVLNIFLQAIFVYFFLKMIQSRKVNNL